MPDEPPKPVTVEELLPAMLELASIQHDLLVALEDPRPKSLYAGNALHLYDTPKRGQPIAIDVGRLINRSRVLIAWLLAKAGPQK